MLTLFLSIALAGVRKKRAYNIAPLQLENNDCQFPLVMGHGMPSRGQSKVASGASAIPTHGFQKASSRDIVPWDDARQDRCMTGTGR
jgi:hypothetical protein